MEVMNFTNREEIWFRRQTDPGTADEIINRSLYKALLRKEKFGLQAWISKKSCPNQDDDDDELEDRGSSWVSAAPEIAKNPQLYWKRKIAFIHWLRVFLWGGLWLLMAFYGGYQCWEILKTYLTYPTATTFGIEEVDKLEFPAVTICSLPSLTPKNRSWFLENNRTAIWSSFSELEDQYANKTVWCGDEGDDEEISDSFDPVLFKEFCLGQPLQNMTSTRRDDCFCSNSYYFYFPEPYILVPCLNEINESDRRVVGDAPTVNKRRKRSIPTNLSANATRLKLREERKLIRGHCDRVYQLFFMKVTLMKRQRLEDNFTIGDTSQCPTGLENLNRSIVMDHVCGTAVFEDIFGSYNQRLEECVPVTNRTFNDTKYVCSTCCFNRVVCSILEVYSDKASLTDFNKFSMQKLEVLIKKSALLDGRDVVDLFTLSSEDIDEASPPINEVIVTCSFDQGPCSSRDFVEWKNSIYGLCYTFNSGLNISKNSSASLRETPIKYTMASGPKNGLRITMNIHSEKSLALLTPELGARVTFHKPRTIPFPENDGIVIPVGVSNSIAITPVNIRREVPPWGQCGETQLNTSFQYTASLCKNLCLEKHIWESCGCYMSLGPAFSQMGNTNLSKCALNDYVTKLCVETSNLENNAQTEKCNCPVSCDEWIYKPNVATSDTAEIYYSILQKTKNINVGDDICSEDSKTVRLHVYCTKLSYESIQQTKTYTFETLLSNLGGTFSLFVGITIVSFFEVGEFIFDLIDRGIQKIFKKKIPEKKKTKVGINMLVDYVVDPLVTDEGDELMSNLAEKRKEILNNTFDKIFVPD